MVKKMIKLGKKSLNGKALYTSLIFQDVLKAMYVTTAESLNAAFKLQVGKNKQTFSNIDVSEVYSEFGRCYSLFLENKFFINLTLMYVLNMKR